ncbi:hypothetical protein C8Q76DRAFT_779144 [Earliella scabrosa]|nr:hypothetical protein C8Q76DRAFT_779144 [Earliella scabrosa]
MVRSLIIGRLLQDAFGPAFKAAGDLPDLVLFTQDQVKFHTHRRRLLHASANSWGNLLATTAHSLGIISLSEDSATMGIVLHVVYGLPCEHLAPSLETIECTLGTLLKYGVTLPPLVVPYRPLFQLIYLYTPFFPIEIYALAARYNLEPLAVAASAHLLSFDTSTVSEELSAKIGPAYFKRLVDLQQLRAVALRDIVCKPLQMHLPTAACGKEEQVELLKRWASMEREVACDASPSASALQGAFERVREGLICGACRRVLQWRAEEAVEEWLAVQTTI